MIDRKGQTLALLKQDEVLAFVDESLKSQPLRILEAEAVHPRSVH